MSTHWGLHCNQCGQPGKGISSPHNFNHGEDVVLDIVAAAPHLNAAFDVQKMGYCEVHFLGDDSNAVLRFALAHFNHDIELENEYGERKPIKPA